MVKRNSDGPDHGSVGDPETTEANRRSVHISPSPTAAVARDIATRPQGKQVELNPTNVDDLDDGIGRVADEVQCSSTNTTAGADKIAAGGLRPSKSTVGVLLVLAATIFSVRQ